MFSLAIGDLVCVTKGCTCFQKPRGSKRVTASFSIWLRNLDYAFLTRDYIKTVRHCDNLSRMRVPTPRSQVARSAFTGIMTPMSERRLRAFSSQAHTELVSCIRVAFLYYVFMV